MRLGRRRRVERSPAGEGGRGEGAALHQDPGRHHGGAVERGVSDRFRAARPSGEPDRRNRTSGPGRWGCDPHQATRPVPGGGAAGARPERETADPQRCRQEEALAVVRRKNAELADLAETTADEAERLLANAKRAVRKAGADAAKLKASGGCDAAAGRRRGQLVRAVDDLTELLDATRAIV